jgi:hypothetical protein
MKRKIFKISIILMMISLVSIACNLGKFEGSDSSSDDNSSNEYSSKEGGFSIQKVQDYTFSEVLGGIEMTAPGAQPEVGPGMQIFGSLTDQELTNDEMWDMITQQSATTFDFDKPDKYKVDDVRGLLAEFEGEQSGEEVRGEVFVVMVKPDQQFFMFGIAPKEEWRKFEPVFMEVLDSVKFFDAVPIDTTSENFDDSVMEENEAHSEEFQPVSPVVDELQLIRQWASNAIASTEYSSTDWSAMQATGSPDVDVCGSDPKAWSPAYIDTEDYIEVYYDVPVIPTELVIYQSYNPSQVVEIQLVDPDGEAWLLWYGDPEEVSDCPDMWTHTIDLEETFLVQSVVIFVDQGIMNWGGVEIDAVELVGYPEGAEIGTSTTVQEPSDETGQTFTGTTGGNIPTNYEGLMAGPVYQGWLNVIINETKEADLDEIMTIPGKKSTENWKPRPDHKDTYLYQMPWDGMTGYISVTTAGVVYKKSINPNHYPNDYALMSVNQETYDQLNAIYNRDKVIPYEVMANLLGSPGFLFEQYHRVDDNMLISQYFWLNGKGGRISGYFLDGKLTGMAGLVFIEE